MSDAGEEAPCLERSDGDIPHRGRSATLVCYPAPAGNVNVRSVDPDCQTAIASFIPVGRPS